MAGSSDVQHHLERGLFLLSRGKVYEARQSWRAALRIDPAHSAALDYLQSTERELTAHDRQRETEDKALEEGTHDTAFEEGTPPDDLPFTEETTEGPDATRMKGERGGAAEAARADEVPEDHLTREAPGAEAAGESAPVESLGMSEAPFSEPAAPAEEQVEEPAERSDGVPPPQEAGHTSATGDTHATSLDEDLNFDDMAGDDWKPLDWLADDEPIEASPPPGEADAAVAPDPTVGSSPSSGAEDEEDTVARVLDSVSQLRAQHRYGAARRLLQDQLEAAPGQEALLEELDRVEQDMQVHYSAILGDLSSVPELTVDMEELYSLDLDQVGGYIISLVDGILTLEDIFTLSAKLDRLTVMQVLGELIEKDLVTLRPG